MAFTCTRAMHAELRCMQGGFQRGKSPPRPRALVRACRTLFASLPLCRAGAERHRAHGSSSA